MKKNVVKRNDNAGILIEEGATDNKVALNISVFNRGQDLVDGNPGCDGNLWKLNIARTRDSDDCIH